ncbi:alpha/beta hydrolase [Nonomuraea sp. NPDC046570]|uniref:alpha/beta hydrolase n=1 Tax=Nonomuraea sp. NPDC046570 TaxID=3155255 RepID=UPI003400F9EB
MKRVVGMVASLAMLVAGLGGSAEATARPGEIAWGPCDQPQQQQSQQSSILGGVMDDLERTMGRLAATVGLAEAAAEPEPATPGVECALVRVPLDYRTPMGQTIKIALNRVKGKVSRDHNHLGTLLVNPGGPGASGQALAEYVAAALPPKLAERFDVVGFDPRGVGRSEPALHCVDPAKYYAAPRPDQVPRSHADERVLIGRAKEYADRCGNMWAWMLPHLSTENAARDLDVVRSALGEDKISYLGYSYGTYLGAVYATLFPQRVKRLVLDSTVDPKGVWYEANLAQNRAFEVRHRAFLSWTASHNRVYKLGRTQRQTGFAWYSMRDRLRTRPAGGVIGPSELDDIFTTVGYSDAVWPKLADAWSRYVKKGDVTGLQEAYKQYAETDAEGENGYAVYLGVQCRDAPWPRQWPRWRADMAGLHREAPFLTWPNAWYNAPCAFWSVPGGKPAAIRSSRALPPILMVQAKDDAATPYAGAMNMRELFPGARLISEPGGNHGVSLSGNRCVDRHLTRYLEEGVVPKATRHRGAPDVACRGLPAPRPATRMAAGGSHGHERLIEIIGR